MKKQTIGVVGVLLLVFCASLMIGKTTLDFSEVAAIFMKEATPAQTLIFWNFRFPRSLIALIGGCGLAFSGFLLQGTTRNDLADGSILGINSGAGLFVMVYLGFFAQGSLLILPMLAMAGGILAAILVFGIAFQRKEFLSMEKILLAGIAVNAGFSALTLLLTIKISKDSYSFVTSWLAGSIWGTTWSAVTTLIPFLLIFTIFAYRKVPMLTILGFGEERAMSLGIKVNRERMILLGTAVGLAACCVAFTGSLGFVGLLAPHISKAWLKQETRSSFLISGAIGGILVLVADIIGRILLTSGEIPAGIIIAIIGAPYFLFLLLRDQF
ncbi:FecCD family ABC transporter permease [Enterococcus massiliensis]|uniref:FecCD family ABC transporter permease n=1 Tax=Enterococcus massiliensis TaxID=1640685 RepID=UPI00065E8A79|nr:iron ABC transporter permease [Enterococcus massiliensis]